MTELASYHTFPPRRIQRKRTKGWRMPPHTLYVGRGSEFGNPFIVGKDGDRAAVVAKFRAMVHGQVATAPEDWRRTECLPWTQSTREAVALVLRGYSLACWCPLDQPCHADVLLELAR